MNEKEIEELIKECIPCVETCTIQFSDSADFHDVHIRSLIELATAAYKLGFQAGRAKLNQDG
jgi:hypothetical protein